MRATKLKRRPKATSPIAQQWRPSEPSSRELLSRFASTQALNADRDTAALRPFRKQEFGSGPAAPSPAHVQAANDLIRQLQSRIMRLGDQVSQAAEDTISEPSATHTTELLLRKERVLQGIRLVEKIWDFYLELFGQRQTPIAHSLLATDRIALDCYQCVYTRLGTARSIPAPAPFTYMETGFTPSTYRRGVRLTRLGRQMNPFPIVQLPYHRLVNPWTLGAVHHEVSHNLQSDLGLWQAVPKRILRRLRNAGLEQQSSLIWSRWHKEIWADLCGLLLGGPAIVLSLLDVIARSPATTLRFNPRGVHPTPYLRAWINFELLRRMNFPKEAEALRRLWHQLYPADTPTNIPVQFLDTFREANRLVVDTICFQPYRQLGDKRLVDVVTFTPNFQQMTEEAAQRLAIGTDPGIVPARFLVSASRWAVDQKLASPQTITRNFYQALNKR